ncbi:hypothetical protein [Nocardiopsis ansamitocini]|uniref:Uncharacterized protein n=1 Tax=Nocardiopsis ansamitocini TaxID=1670832 RepID=A0A9W6UJC1_9ACTN|nr:hypothetical protein [Nocardiopsis ansamitocini]GLU47900.1 hypothetical protein Nans01_22510 [Nocardiopsis ansamitocini]
MTHYPDPHHGAGDPNVWNTGGHPNPQVPPPMDANPNAHLSPYSAQTGGYQAPPGYSPQMQPAYPEQPLAVLGDITVTQSTVMTPAGVFPIKGSMWTLNDMTFVRRDMPGWAIAVALVGFFFVCVFSLFFLMVKETTVSGSIQVSVRQGDNFHTTQIPVHSVGQARQIHDQFQYARTLAF